MTAKKTSKKTTKKTSKAKQKRVVLLDAHAILHRAYHALPDFSSPKGEPTGALYGLVAMLLKIVEELKPDYIAACFDLPEPTYRHEAYENYKAGRAETDDSLVMQIDRSRDIFEAFGITIYEHPGFEADDMLGTIVEQVVGNKAKKGAKKEFKNLDVVIASGDMDTLQLVDEKRVKVYTLRKGIKDTIMYDEKMVKERFGFGSDLIPDYKGLRGDPSDNIPGIAGIGEKTATELIVNFGSIEEMYSKLEKSEATFLKKGIKPRIINLLKENKEEAEFSKMLATIRRDAPITFVLPEKTWRDALDVDQVLTLFSEFGFRTLSSRVRILFGGEVDGVDGGVGGGEAAAPKKEEKIDQEKVIEAAVALWLLHSDQTNASKDDILEYGRAYGNTTSFKEAYDFIMKELADSPVKKVYDNIEKPLMKVLRHMEENGVKLDVEFLGTLSKKMHKELEKIQKEIFKHAGDEFNVNSPKQLGEVLFDKLEIKPKSMKRTATGQRTTKESELEKLRDEHPIIPLILRYREVQKLLSTYIDNFPDMVGSDGRVHTTFLQSGAATGRMATQNPALQNIPIRTEEGRLIRNAFVASRGYRIVAIDYSQIELRVAAILSGDEKFLEIFRNGEDVHESVAMRVFGVSAKEVDGEMRRRAKVINFGILYGMGVNALRQNLGEDTGRKEAQEFLNAYFHTFIRLAEYLEDTKAFARKNGYTETLFGRRRHFKDIESAVPFIRAAAERMAINAPIQGTAADIVRIAMNEVYTYLKKENLLDDARMLIQVHDELVFEVKEKMIEKVVPKIVSIMESVLNENQSRGVPLTVSVGIGKNWGELEKK